MNALQAAAKIVRVPEDAVVEGSVVMVTYINPDGQQSMLYTLHGDLTVAQVAGMFEIAKNDILHR